jgi:hypothetical protein
MIADTFGRRIVLTLCVISILLHDLWTLMVLYFDNIFPLNAVYFSAAFIFVGGGAPLLLPLLLVMAANASPNELR